MRIDLTRAIWTVIRGEVADTPKDDAELAQETSEFIARAFPDLLVGASQLAEPTPQRSAGVSKDQAVQAQAVARFAKQEPERFEAMRP